jgi:CheY-like chemotaxis protein
MEAKRNVEVLLVEDSPTQSVAITFALEKTGHIVHIASDGEEGLLKLGEHQPDVLLTDLNMPGLSGLELLKIVRQRFPHLPVILMTGEGNDAVVAEALQNGAASYVAKDKSMGALLETIDRIVGASTFAHSFGYLLDSIERCHYSFALKNDRALVVSLVQYLQHLASRAGLTDQEERRNLGVAVEEALLNALYHGSLEVPGAFREMEQEARAAVVEERCRAAPYKDRRIHVTADITPEAVEVIVRDEGPGFDYRARFGSLGAEDGTVVVSGGMRGLILMHMFMDEVEFLGTGNEVRLVKRLAAPSNATGAAT